MVTLWWHSVVAVTSLPSSSLHLALAARCNPACSRVRAEPPFPLCLQPGCAVAWPAGQGDSAGCFIVPQVLAEPWPMLCSPFAVLSCGWLWEIPSCSKPGHSPASPTLDVKALLELVWVTHQCSPCLACTQPCSVWDFGSPAVTVMEGCACLSL